MIEGPASAAMLPGCAAGICCRGVKVKVAAAGVKDNYLILGRVPDSDYEMMLDDL